MSAKNALLLALVLSACSSAPPAPRSDVDQAEPAPDHLSVVVQDQELRPLVEYGASWWGETNELPIVLVDTCDEAIELCCDADWTGTVHKSNGDVGGITRAPAIGRRGSLAISKEVLTVPRMPAILPELVASHELGHALGREHVEEPSELMYATRDATPTPVCIDGQHCRDYGAP